MADYLVQQKGQPLRSGFYNKDAFRQKGRSVLVLKTAIAGLNFNVDLNSDNGRELLDELKPGTELFLFRDSDNKYDEWAITVFASENREIGFVTRFKNETIARLMDYGKVFHAFVDERPDPLTDEEKAKSQKAPTEDYKVPFSIYMDD